MKISNNWLKDYIKTELKAEKIGEYLTDIGLEVEGIEPFENIKGGLEGIVVGKVLTCEKHPNADKLKKTTVDIGGQILEIVCGAPNVEAGQVVPVATVGTKIYTKDGGFFEIKEAKIRGEKSQGMICAEDELGLSDDHGGIMVLDEEKFVVGEPFAKYFEIVQDEVFEIGLTPNRTDAMSHYGVARDLKAFLVSNGFKVEFEKINSEKLNTETETDFKIEIENNDLCPRYIGAVIENIKVEDSPNWLKNRLKAIGLAPINNVVDITNYILHGLGQPLHAFDYDKIKGKKIRVGNSPEGTKFTTLDGVERTLNGTEIMIKDAENTPLCIAGVFGGLHSGVSAETKTIVLESAYFNPVAVRKGAKFHGLNTDASFRFERGIDPNNVKTAITHAIKMIEEITGGVYKGMVEHFPEKINHHYVLFRYSMLDQILGIKIHREKVKEILRLLDIEILNEIPNGLELSVPPYRADVTREIDVIEEVMRIYGYNKIEAPQKISFTPVRLTLDDQDELENFWARTLQANGFNEVMNNSLTSVKDETNAVKLLNPLSGDLAFMRKSLLEGLLQNTIYNINRRATDIKFFEIGKIYHKKDKYEERKQLALLVSGREKAENWLVQKSATDFYYLKAYVKTLLDRLNIDIEEVALENDGRFSDALQLMSNGKVLARLGKVSSQLLKDFDIEQDCYYAEIEIETAQKLREGKVLKFADIPKFNKLRRDLALLIDKNITYADLYKAAKNNGGKYLKNINLFDVYEGKNLPENKKSYALSFELLNEEKTLEEKEISEVMNKLIKTFEKEFGAELRS